MPGTVVQLKPKSSTQRTAPRSATPPVALSRAVDLRGMRPAVEAPSILADPTGRRARRLRIAGRVLATLFLLWLVCLLLAGLGMLPVSDVPLAGTIRAAQEPARITGGGDASHGAAASARPLAGLGNVLRRVTTHGAGPTAAVRSARAGHGAGAAARHAAAVRIHAERSRHGSSGVTGGGAGHGSAASGNSGSSHATASGGGSGAGQGSSAPASSSGTTSTTHGNGQGRSTSHPTGSSTTTPATTSTTTHGSSGSAPGHDPTRTTGHGAAAG